MRIGYVAATAIQAGGSFALVALLTRLLGPHEYGRWALLEPVLLLGGQFVSGGLGWGIIKMVAQDGYSPIQAIRISLRYALIPAVLCAALLAGAIVLWRGGAASAYVAVLIFLLAEGSVALIFSAARGADAVRQYLAGVSVRMLGLVAVLYASLAGIAGSITVASQVVGVWALCSVCAAALAYRMMLSATVHSTPPVVADQKTFKRALAYGAPILLAALLAAIVGNADRYVLGAYARAEVVATYAVIAKAAAALNLIVTPINLWWPTARFRHLKDADAGRRFFSQTALALTYLLGICGGLIFLFSPTLAKIFYPAVEFDSRVAGSLCLAALFTALTSIMNVGTLKEGKTMWSVVTVGVAALIQLIAAALLVPKLGMHGAALSAAFSAAASLVLQNALSQKIHFVPYSYIRQLFVLILIASAAAALYVLVPEVSARVAGFTVSCVLIGYLVRVELVSFLKTSP